HRDARQLHSFPTRRSSDLKPIDPQDEVNAAVRRERNAAKGLECAVLGAHGCVSNTPKTIFVSAGYYNRSRRPSRSIWLLRQSSLNSSSSFAARARSVKHAMVWPH